MQDPTRRHSYSILMPASNEEPVALTATSSTAVEVLDKNSLKHKRRYCREPGCTRIVKSQGLCQRHGAKPRKCKVEGCPKQAQGNFDGMCKSHFKAHKRETTPLPPKPDPALSANGALEPPPPEGASVYDVILPASIAWRTTSQGLMPLIQHLKDGFDAGKAPAWHRNEERRARGLWPVHNPATQLEGWERELVWMEILVLTGNPDASFRHLARSWGRDKGFHMVLAQFICGRRGDVERKKRERLALAAAAHRKRVRKEGGTGTHVDKDGHIVADVWDDACYGDAAYNEALAADLLDFDPDHGQRTASGNTQFSFEVGDLHGGEVVSTSDDGHQASEAGSVERPHIEEQKEYIDEENGCANDSVNNRNHVYDNGDENIDTQQQNMVGEHVPTSDCADSNQYAAYSNETYTYQQQQQQQFHEQQGHMNDGLGNSQQAEFNHEAFENEDYDHSSYVDYPQPPASDQQAYANENQSNYQDAYPSNIEQSYAADSVYDQKIEVENAYPSVVNYEQSGEDNGNDGSNNVESAV